MTQRSQQAQTKIMQAFSRLLVQQGYSRTTMRQLALACSMSRGHIAFYYKRKDDLLLALIDFFSHRTDAMAAGSAPQDAGARFFLRYLLQYYLIAQTPAAYHVMAELSDRAAYLDKRVERAYTGLLEVLAPLEVPVSKPEVFIGCLCAIRSIYPLAKYWLHTKKALNYQRLFQIFCDALVTQSGIACLAGYGHEAIRIFETYDKTALAAYVGDLRAFILGETHSPVAPA